MKAVLLVMMGMLLCFGCQKESSLETTTIKANTMVCGTCAKTVKQAVYGVEGVKDVSVDLDRKIVEVKFVPAQTNLATIERAITDVGYDANEKQRDPDAYAKLEECCKLERD